MAMSIPTYVGKVDATLIEGYIFYFSVGNNQPCIVKFGPSWPKFSSYL